MKNKIFKTEGLERITYVLMDVEGTTSDINFVKNVLFPYSAQMMEVFLSENSKKSAVGAALELMQAKDWKSALPQLLKWIKDDVKHPALKSLQGMIWKKGFESGEFKSHVYKDVPAQWKNWSKKGLTLGIYSSGSVAAQQLFFTHTEMGDLLPFISDHFDLDIGGKREPESYKKIAKKLDIPVKEILFLSDVPEELAAAQKAGMSVAHIVRSGTSPSADWPSYADFTAL